MRNYEFGMRNKIKAIQRYLTVIPASLKPDMIFSIANAFCVSDINAYSIIAFIFKIIDNIRSRQYLLLKSPV